MQAGAIQPGQTVVVIDDLIATGQVSQQADLQSTYKDIFFVGGSAKAAGELVAKEGGKTVEYLFVIELLFLKASSKLDAPVYSIVKSED